MSYDFSQIMEYSQKASNRYDKCHDFATNSGTVTLPEGAIDCLNKYCPKPRAANSLFQTHKVYRGIDLSAGVF